MKTHITARPSCRRAAETESSFRSVGIARCERICFRSSIGHSLRLTGRSVPNRPRAHEKQSYAVDTRQSKREAIAFGLALIFVVGAGSGFAWSIANLMILLNRALPAMMQSQAHLGLSR
jgi:hypothetical protein